MQAVLHTIDNLICAILYFCPRPLNFCLLQIMFICYEGTLKGIDGPAKGVNCEDVGVSEDSDTPTRHSLQLENRISGGEPWRLIDSVSSTLPSIMHDSLYINI